MIVLSIIRHISAFALLFSATVAQIPPNLPVDDATLQYLESLSPEKLAAILKIFEQAISGQVPAPPELIEQQELYWSYEMSPPVYPTREFDLNRQLVEREERHRSLESSP
jgi:hypothetical protein